MLSWWPGDGNASDIVGSNPGTLTGVGFVSGKVGQAFSFDGNDFIDFGDVLDFERTNPLTFDFWIKQEPTVSEFNFVIAKQDNYNAAGSNNGQGYLIGTSGGTGKVHFALINNQIGGSSNWLGVTGSSNVRDGIFHHVAVTYDGLSSASGVGIYVDGEAETLEVLSDTLSSTTVTAESFRFGAREGATFSLFQGVLDEVEVYNRALSGAEIKSIYDAGSLGKAKP